MPEQSSSKSMAVYNPTPTPSYRKPIYPRRFVNIFHQNKKKELEAAAQKTAELEEKNKNKNGKKEIIAWRAKSNIIEYVEENEARKRKERTTRSIIERVATFHGISYKDIIGEDRRRGVVKARFDAILAVYNAFPGRSLSQYGRIFERDHNSILHALKKMGVKSVAKAEE